MGSVDTFFFFSRKTRQAALDFAPSSAKSEGVRAAAWHDAGQ
jgi:hypothetical protein